MIYPPGSEIYCGCSQGCSYKGVIIDYFRKLNGEIYAYRIKQDNETLGDININKARLTRLASLDLIYSLMD